MSRFVCSLCSLNGFGTNIHQNNLAAAFRLGSQCIVRTLYAIKQEFSPITFALQRHVTSEFSGDEQQVTVPAVAERDRHVLLWCSVGCEVDTNVCPGE